MKLDLLTNATVVDDAIRFVYQKSQKLKPFSGNINEDENKSNDPDYEEHREVNHKTITTNEIF
jgi:hypothetical protein